MPTQDEVGITVVQSRARQRDIMSLLLAQPGTFDQPAQLAKFNRVEPIFILALIGAFVLFIAGFCVANHTWGMLIILAIYSPIMTMLFVKSWMELGLHGGNLTADRNGLTWVQSGNEIWNLPWDRIEELQVEKSSFWGGGVPLIRFHNGSHVFRIPFDRNRSPSWARLWVNLVLTRPEINEPSPHVGLISSLQLGGGLLASAFFTWLVHSAAQRMGSGQYAGAEISATLGLFGGVGAFALVANAVANLATPAIMAKYSGSQTTRSSLDDFSAPRYASWITKAKTNFQLRDSIDYEIPAEVRDRLLTRKFTGSEIHSLVLLPILLLTSIILPLAMVPLVPLRVIPLLAGTILFMGIALPMSVAAEKKNAKPKYLSRYRLVGDELKLLQPNGTEKSYRINLAKQRWVHYFQARWTQDKNGVTMPLGLLEPLGSNPETGPFT